MKYACSLKSSKPQCRGPWEKERCAIEITEALDTAHNRAVIHRVLKPGNREIRGQVAGFRSRESAGRGSRRGYDGTAHADYAPHRRRNYSGNAAIHGAKTVGRKRGRCAHRHLRAGYSDLRNGHEKSGIVPYGYRHCRVVICTTTGRVRVRVRVRVSPGRDLYYNSGNDKVRLGVIATSCDDHRTCACCPEGKWAMQNPSCRVWPNWQQD
jgi:hypothetical protein